MRLHLILLSLFATSGLAAKVRPAKNLARDENNLPFEEFEEKFHEFFESGKWKDIAEHELQLEEHEIEAANEAYKEGFSSFWEKLNEFSAWTKEDVEALIEGAKDPGKERFFGLIEPSEENKKLSREAEAYLKKTYARLARTDVPDSYDAREHGLITSVKNQASCGSCAAFASNTVMETCMLKEGASLDDLDLSEQQILDCGYDGECMSGWNGACPHSYISFMAENGGRDWSHENQYAYEANTYSNNCQEKGIWQSGAKVTESIYDYSCDEEKMKQLVYEYGAVETGIYASDSAFGNYGGGVFTGCSTGVNSNHAVVAVGYGTENGEDYWIVKNSWGSGWGDGGYIKIKRGASQCNIGAWCMVAECTATGSSEPSPDGGDDSDSSDDVPTDLFCDVSAQFGEINGPAELDMGLGPKSVLCEMGVCSPHPAGPSNACIYICGELECTGSSDYDYGTTEASTGNGCVYPHWATDNICDDENNVPECDYDGGACCQVDPPHYWDNYCTECECKTPNCAIPHWSEDRWCDDENNNPACNFDGGACCQDNPLDGWDNYCTECECLHK